MKTSESIIQNPEIKLEDVRSEWGANTHTGRGTETAAGRGYNTERLAYAVLNDRGNCSLSPLNDSWYDTFATGEHDAIRAESKSCVYRYPSGAFGRFRIWRKNHRRLMEKEDILLGSPKQFLYFFVVYTIKDGIEKEVGKLVVPAKTVDKILDQWSTRNHSSMGEEPARDISWNLLLKRLEISREAFVEQNVIDLTTETNYDRK